MDLNPTHAYYIHEGCTKNHDRMIMVNISNIHCTGTSNKIDYRVYSHILELNLFQFLSYLNYLSIYLYDYFFIYLFGFVCFHAHTIIYIDVITVYLYTECCEKYLPVIFSEYHHFV